MASTANHGAEVAPRHSRPRRGKRYLLVALGLLAIIGVLAGLKGAQIATLMGAGKRAQAAGPPPETVNSVVAVEQTWNEMLQSVGSVASARGVNISNDAPGMVSKIAFESGKKVRAGEVLVELDTRVERAQLVSARARRALASTNADRTRNLARSGAVAPAQKDTDDTQLASAAAEENALMAQIERKIVRAPFTGTLGIRLVNIGQYLAPGTPITVLESDESTYVDFSLPQQSIGVVAVGMPVRLTAEGDAERAGPTEGKIYAVEPTVDPATRNVKLRATVQDEKNHLRPGMFVNVSVVLPSEARVVAIPATAVVHAAYGDSVFVVDGGGNAAGNKTPQTVRQQFVRLGQYRGDFAAIEDGIKVGDQVVTAGAFKLRNKARVVVDNSVELRPELAPRPSNR
jgi:membrane fusion protein (multidrug efflux system)